MKLIRFLSLILALGVILFLCVLQPMGCSRLKPQKKEDALIPEKFREDVESGKVMLVGDYTNVGNFHNMEVRGVGLVQGLAGTGCDDINSLERKLVYEEMLKLGVNDIRSVLASPTTAVVNILGYMRAGIQEGEHFDVEMVLPAETEGKSLRGGWLMNSPLTDMRIIEGTLGTGKTYAFVQGPIMVDPLATETVNPTGLKTGVILSGARALKARQLMLHMKHGHESAFITDRIAKEINNRFYFSTGQKKGVASAKTDTLIVLDVHPAYKDDVSRYIRIVQSIACYESPQRQLRRIEELREDLRNPEKSQLAAFQLEALGKKGTEPLQSALQNKNKEVRFHAATSLAYLGDGAATQVLADLSRNEPAFRVYALNALSLLKNDIDAEVKLQELLHVPSAETRYGAFRALCQRNPYDRTIRGEVLTDKSGNRFSFHVVSTNSSPMVHVTRTKKPEIVVFGSNICLKQPFALNAGPRIFVNGQAQEGVVVSRFAVSGLDEKRFVSNRLDEIIRTVVELGGTYPDVVQMLYEAERDLVLSARLEKDCLPEPNRVYRRMRAESDDEEDNEPERKKQTFWQQMSNPKGWFEPNPGGKSSDDTEPTNTSGRE